MAGNLYEWVQDGYHSNYVGAPDDGSAWPDPTGGLRVVRGGSWLDSTSNLRSARRNVEAPDASDRSLGFRCVAPPPP